VPMQVKQLFQSTRKPWKHNAVISCVYFSLVL
jgi:hypothetical protein